MIPAATEAAGATRMLLPRLRRKSVDCRPRQSRGRGCTLLPPPLGLRFARTYPRNALLAPGDGYCQLRGTLGQLIGKLATKLRRRQPGIDQPVHGAGRIDVVDPAGAPLEG